MKFRVIVRPNARKEGVEAISENEYRVSVNAPAREGEANAALLRVLGAHFGVRPSRFQILLGQKSKRKLVQMKDED